MRLGTRVSGLRPSKLMPIEKSMITGFREFDPERYAAVVVWLCQRIRVVTATSLNKLLFYADFRHFKSESVSLTGAAYVHLDHGPVPAAYGDLREFMELRGLIEAREVEYQNGHTGEEFKPGPEAGSLPMEFNARELATLEAIVEEFKDTSPSEIRHRSHREDAYKKSSYLQHLSYEHAPALSLPVPG